MKRFGVSGLALLMIVTLVVTGPVQADKESKKLVDLSLPKISLKKAECCKDKKECCDKKEACRSASSKLLDRAKGLISKKAECTGKEDCPVCNKAKKTECTGKDDCPVCNAKKEGCKSCDSKTKKLTGKATETAKQLTGKASAVVQDGAEKAKETVSKLRERTEKVIGKVKK